MTRITIELTDSRTQALKDRAEASGVSVEELASRVVSDYVAKPRPSVMEAAKESIRENSELLRRLS